MLVSGGGKNKCGYIRGADYGCPNYALRGTCTNSRRVKRDTLERELLAKLPDEVLSDAAIDYVLERLEKEIEKRFDSLNGEMEEMKRRKAKLELELKNLSRAIAEGMDSPVSRAAITEREAEISAITGKNSPTISTRLRCCQKDKATKSTTKASGSS